MKNLKKLLALVVACVMVFGMVASAAVVDFPDVAVTAKYAEAVKVLSGLNIINGDDKGNFNPDMNVTRAEMAKILCALLSKNATFGQTDSGFADVTAAHWASGYVKHAKGLGYINGYDATTFGPEDNVTYEQAIKLIVAATGWSLAADANGGYPAGYMLIAADKNITKNVVIADATAPAKRSDIALLAFNALEVKMMKRDTYGTSAEYREGDETLLKNKLGATKLEGTVASTYADAPATHYEAGTMTFSVKGKDKDGKDEYKEATYLCADPTAPEFLGYKDVTAYVVENDEGKDEIIAVTAKAYNVAEYVFEDLDVLATDKDKLESDEAMSIVNDGTGLFSYWSTADHDDKRPTVLKIEDKATVFVNGKIADKFDKATVIPEMGTIVAMDTNGDDKLDLFKVTSYTLAMIKSVNARTLRVGFDKLDIKDYSAPKDIILNEDECEFLTDIVVTIDGEAAELTDLQKGDIVFIRANGTDLTKYKNFTFVEVIASRKFVEGKATSAIDDETNTITIGTEEYEVARNFAIAIRDEGKFFLAPDGTIVAKEVDVAKSDKYGYLHAGNISGFGTVEVKLFTAEGKDELLTISESIKINGKYPKTRAAFEALADEDIKTIFGTKDVSAYDIYNAKGEAYKDGEAKNGVSPAEIILAIAKNGAYEEKLISYEVSGTTLTAVNLADNKAAAKELEWKNGVFLDAGVASIPAEGAKFFMIDKKEKDAAKWSVVDASALINEVKYEVAFYSEDDEKGEYAVVLVADSGSVLNTDGAFAYYKSSVLTYYGEDEEDVWAVTYIQNGKEETKYVWAEGAKEANSKLYELFDADKDSDIALGSVFFFSTDDDANVISDLEVVYAPAAVSDDTLKAGYAWSATDAFKKFTATNNFYATDSEAKDQIGKNEVQFGVLADVTAVEGGLEITIADKLLNVRGSIFKYVVEDDANVVVLNDMKKVKKDAEKVYAAAAEDALIASYCDIEKNKLVIDADAELRFVLVRKLNNKVVDVYVLNYEDKTF